MTPTELALRDTHFILRRRINKEQGRSSVTFSHNLDSLVCIISLCAHFWSSAKLRAFGIGILQSLF
jgi:hypothetical protein